jgi:fatty-acyl-CoA synthase
MLTGDMLRRSTERFPLKPAIVAGNVRLTYRELDAAANRLAHALRATGAAKGAKVAILSRNLPQYGIVFFGAARSGLVLVNVSIQYAAAELEYVLQKSDAEILIVDGGLSERAAAVLPRCPAFHTVVSIGHADLPGCVGFERFIEGHPVTPPDFGIQETDPFSMTYTGGTTGRPKGVLCSHRRSKKRSTSATWWRS